jgi:nitrogen fixation NifU-like protein
MKLWIAIKSDRISDIAFQSFGCPGAIATSSMLTELAKGKTVEQAKQITDDDVVEALGGIPERKRHCSLLGVQALQAAINDYEKQRLRQKGTTRLDASQVARRGTLSEADTIDTS